MNKPYIKQIDSLGRVQNPITKENPYQSRVFLGMERDREGNEYPVFYPNRQERNQKKPRFKAKYGKQFIQTLTEYRLIETGKCVKLEDVINYTSDEITSKKKQIVHTRKK